MDVVASRMTADKSREAAFLSLISRFERQLAACVHALVPEWNDAAEVLQQTRVQLWEQFDNFQLGSDFLAWARTVARYQVRTELKRRRRRLVFSETVIDALLARSAERDRKDNRRWKAFVACSEKLSAAARELLNRCYLRREKIKDVAGQMGRTPNSTYATLFRIRKELSSCMQARMQKEDDL
jgi:RNA polymerase sigma-70 factor (ECF subfamily)